MEYKDLANGVGEDRPLDFHSPYGYSKGAADQYMIAYARIYCIHSDLSTELCLSAPANAISNTSITD
jgi:CDP-paratose 2-epimerase